MDYEYRDCTELDSVLRDYPGLFEAIVIDCETTGIYHYDKDHRNYVLQLSIISAHTGLCLYNGYFRPKIKEWPEAESVNHISPEMVKDAPTFKKEAKKIQAIIDAARVIIGYNTLFDTGFLELEGITFGKLRILTDVMEDYANYNGMWHDFFHTYTWRKLTVAAKRTGFDWSSCPAEAHNSWADCLATLHVARWLQDLHNRTGWIPYDPPCTGYESDGFGCGDFSPEDCARCIRIRRRNDAAKKNRFRSGGAAAYVGAPRSSAGASGEAPGEAFRLRVEKSGQT